MFIVVVFYVAVTSLHSSHGSSPMFVYVTGCYAFHCDETVHANQNSDTRKQNRREIHFFY